MIDDDRSSQQLDSEQETGDEVISNSNIILRNEALENSTTEFYNAMQDLYLKFLNDI